MPEVLVTPEQPIEPAKHLSSIMQRFLAPSFAQDSDEDEQLDLLRKGANPNVANDFGETLLHWAAFNGLARVMAQLVNNGADVNAVDRIGVSALQTAIFHDHHDQAMFLLEHGANPNNVATASPFVGSPLFHAAGGNDLELVRRLIERGADVNLGFNKQKGISPGNSPLFNAVRNCDTTYTNNLAISTTLLEHGADVNCRGSTSFLGENNTPLHIAASEGEFEKVKLLMEHGADPTLRNGNGRTALDLLEDSLRSSRERAHTEAQHLAQMSETEKSRAIWIVEPAEKTIKRFEKIKTYMQERSGTTSKPHSVPPAAVQTVATMMRRENTVTTAGSFGAANSGINSTTEQQGNGKEVKSNRQITATAPDMKRLATSSKPLLGAVKLTESSPEGTLLDSMKKDEIAIPLKNPAQPSHATPHSSFKR